MFFLQDNTEGIQLLITVIWISTGCLIAVLICLHSLYLLIYKDSSSWINKTYRNLATIVMIASTLCSIGDLINIIIYTVIEKPDIHQLFLLILPVITYALYFVGNIMFYTLILLRIYVPFQLNKCTVCSLSFIIFIFGISSIIYCLGLLPSVTFNNKYWTMIVIVLSTNDLILNAFILIIFVVKMKQTISKLEAPLSYQTKQNDENVNLLSNVTTKHCILFGIAVIVNQGFFISSIYQFVVVDFSWTYYWFLYSIRTLETVVNVLVLWLMLRVNYNKYICFCKSCHLCLGKCCFNNINAKSFTKNPYIQLQDL